MEIRIENQMTIAQVEIAIDASIVKGTSPVIIRFDPEHEEKLAQHGIKATRYLPEKYSDVYVVKWDKSPQIINKES